MNDLFTILIILAAIFSFINKIFGKKKKSGEDGEGGPVKPPFQWDLPWEIQDEDEEKEFVEKQPAEPAKYQERMERQLEYEEIYKPPLEDIPQRTRSKLNPIEEEEIPLENFQVDLSTTERLREGIVLSEILGPCRAKKRFN